MARPLKWSDEWIATATTHALEVAYDVARGNSMYVGETRGNASRSFFWSRRAGDVKKELDRRRANVGHCLWTGNIECEAP